MSVTSVPLRSSAVMPGWSSSERKIIFRALAGHHGRPPDEDARPSVGPYDVCAACVAAAETHIQAMFALSRSPALPGKAKSSLRSTRNAIGEQPRRPRGIGFTNGCHWSLSMAQSTVATPRRPRAMQPSSRGGSRTWPRSRWHRRNPRPDGVLRMDCIAVTQWISPFRRRRSTPPGCTPARGRARC